MRKSEELPQFRPDYIISWDSSEKDHTCVSIMQLKRDGAHIVGELVGFSHEKSGCISLLQVMEKYEDLKRREAKRAEDRKELIKKMGESASAATKAMNDVAEAVKKEAEQCP